MYILTIHLMDGVATPQEYVNRAVELGMPAIAITDHGTLSGHSEMYRTCKSKRVSNQFLA
jgi:DNA polymerase-3 subunit alpha